MNLGLALGLAAIWCAGNVAFALKTGRVSGIGWGVTYRKDAPPAFWMFVTIYLISALALGGKALFIALGM